MICLSWRLRSMSVHTEWQKTVEQGEIGNVPEHMPWRVTPISVKTPVTAAVKVWLEVSVNLRVVFSERMC